jgi:hypothetical protein
VALRDYVLGLTAAPLSAPAMTIALRDEAPDELASSLAHWLRRLRPLNPALDADAPSVSGDGRVVLDMRRPYGARIGYRVVPERELLAGPELVVAAAEDPELDLSVLALCGYSADPDVARAVEACAAAAREAGDSLLTMEPRWVAAVVHERRPPLLVGDIDLAAGDASPFLAEPA